MTVKNIIKIVVTLISGIGLICCSIILVNNRNARTSTSSLGNSVIDSTDLRELAGLASYIFEGEIVADNGITANEILIRDAGGEDSGLVYMEYTVVIHNNLKGNLKLDTEIPIYKMCIDNGDGTVSFFEKGDFLPEVGQTGIFFAAAHEDGSLDIGGASGFIPIEANQINSALSVKSRSSTSVYEDIQTAIENEIVIIEQQYEAASEYTEE